MEGNMDMTSNASNSTVAAASAPHNYQQEVSKKVQTEQKAGGSGEPKLQPTQEAALCCPRCDSENTKFCYYNNYNLNQPRHFCKNCRRYWTQGGSLRVVPVGGGCRRNKRASSSSSSSVGVSSTTATSAEMENTFKTRLMLTAASTKSMPCSPTTGLIPNDKLPMFMPIGGSGGLDVAMDKQLGFMPFAPLSLPDDEVLELAPGGSDTTPTFLDMLTGGCFDAGSSSCCYDRGLSMGGMDMSFLLPGMGASASDPMQLQWPSAEIDNYFSNDSGYAAAPAAGVEQQQEEDDNNKAKGAEG